MESIGVKVLRDKIEDLSKDIFLSLEENDILFIDSSHIIRPGGDVLFEFLELLPLINKGVIIHVHDIFTPRHYPREWMIDQRKLWNEQYILEAFLTNNKNFEIISAVNYLKHSFPNELSKSCPVFAEQLQEREPGSFWIRKVL